MNLIRLRGDPTVLRSLQDSEGLVIQESSAEVQEDGQITLGALATVDAIRTLQAAGVEVVVMLDDAGFDEYLETMARRNFGDEPVGIS